MQHSYLEHSNLKDLNSQISDNIRDILDRLDIEYSDNNNRLVLPCPVHHGDNKEGCSIFFDDDKYSANWKCFTHNCHNQQTSLVSLLKLLTNKNIFELKKWLLEFNIKESPNFSSKEDLSFIKTCSILSMENRESNTEYSLSTLNKLSKNIPFYIDRGFKKETLLEYGVGFCYTKGKFFYNRIVVPIFNEDKTLILGFVGRTIYPKCFICDKYHYPNISCDFKTRKWVNSKGFNTNSFLYNYWNFKTTNSRTLYICEGQADIWRFWEAGIKNVVGIFGVTISDEQRILLEKSGVTNIVFFLDPDKAGEDGFKRSCDDLSRFYNISKINYEKQPSDCSVEELKNIIEKSNNGNIIF
jgi:5S rRNA maturation endonuclease (ribonuclease M5)